MKSRMVNVKHIGLFTLLFATLFLGIIISISKMSDMHKTDYAQTSMPEIRYEIVTTSAAQEKGLGGRTSIEPNYGMLFAFPKPERYGFWMKDMLISIDILWLSDNGTILAIDPDISPLTYPKPFYPPRPVSLVLEMKAGEAARLGLKVGGEVPLPLPYGK